MSIVPVPVPMLDRAVPPLSQRRLGAPLTFGPLRRALEAVAWAVPRTAIGLPALQGVCLAWSSAPAGVCAVATDGVTLVAASSEPLPEAAAQDQAIVLSAAEMERLVRCGEACDDSAPVRFTRLTEYEVAVRVGEQELRISTLPHRYPDWTVLLPPGAQPSLELPSARLHSAVEAVCRAGDGRASPSPGSLDIELHARPDGLLIHDSRGRQALVHTLSPHHARGSVSLDASVLLDTLRHLPPDEPLSLTLSGPREPIAISNRTETQLWLLMPRG